MTVSSSRRATRLNSHTRSLVVQPGPQLFGDPDARSADLVATIIDMAARMRTAA